MSESQESSSDHYFRFGQRSLVFALCLILILGVIALAMVTRPEVGSRWMVPLGWMLPIGIVIALSVLRRTTLRGARWRDDVPGVRAILQDEWRRTTMDRALRVAFSVVLIAQLPLALALARLPVERAVMGMAVATGVLGLATFLALFLFFGRQAADEQ